MAKRHEFRQSSNGSNRYVGSWSEPESPPIPLPWSADSLRQVLIWGAERDSAPYPHQSIVHWCDRFAFSYLEIDCAPDLERALRVAADVECQWDLYLANTYSLQELQSLDFTAVRLPTEWFRGWLNDLSG